MVNTRVAVPVQPPVLKPSLIPFDVLQEVERETRVVADQEPSTSPLAVPDDLPIFTEVDDEALRLSVLVIGELRQGAARVRRRDPKIGRAHV